MRLRSSESQFSYEMCQTHIYKETKKHPPPCTCQAAKVCIHSSKRMTTITRNHWMNITQCTSQNILARASACVVDPVSFLSSSLIAMQNVVAVFHIVCAQACRSHKFWGRCMGPASLWRGGWPVEIRPPHLLPYQIWCCRSNRMGVGNFNSKIHNVHVTHRRWNIWNPRLLVSY